MSVLLGPVESVSHTPRIGMRCCLSRCQIFIRFFPKTHQTYTGIGHNHPRKSFGGPTLQTGLETKPSLQKIAYSSEKSIIPNCKQVQRLWFLRSTVPTHCLDLWNLVDSQATSWKPSTQRRCCKHRQSSPLATCARLAGASHLDFGPFSYHFRGGKSYGSYGLVEKNRQNTVIWFEKKPDIWMMVPPSCEKNSPCFSGWWGTNQPLWKIWAGQLRLLFPIYTHELSHNYRSLTMVHGQIRYFCGHVQQQTVSFPEGTWKNKPIMKASSPIIKPPLNHHQTIIKIQ